MMKKSALQTFRYEKKKGPDPLSDPTVLRDAEREEHEMQQWLAKQVARLQTIDHFDTRRDDGVEEDVDHYLRTTCATPLLTWEQTSKIAEDISHHHSAWNSAFFGIPTLQTVTHAFLSMVHTTGHRRVFNYEAQGDEAREALACVDGLLQRWNALSVDERTEGLVAVGVKHLWMEKIQKAACTVFTAAQTRPEEVDVSQADKDNIFISEEIQNNPQCCDLLRIIRTLSASKISTALDGITVAEMSHGEWVVAKQKLCLSNMRLVVAVAKKYRNMGIPFTDLISEGATGLMRATEIYDLKYGYKFSTLATWWIRQSIARAVEDKSRLVRHKQGTRTVKKQIAKMRTDFLQDHHRYPTVEELASALGVDVQTVCALDRKPISLDQPVGHGDASLGDMILDDHGMPSPDAVALIHADREAIDKVLKTLTYKEREIIKLRYGLGDGYPYTLEQTGRIFKVTRERIRQIEQKALKKLRGPEREKYFKGFRDDEEGDDADV